MTLYQADLVDLPLRDRKLIEAVCEFANREIGSAEETEVACASVLFIAATNEYRVWVPQDPDDYSSRPVQEPFTLFDEFELDRACGSIRIDSKGEESPVVLGQMRRSATFKLLKRSQAEVIKWFDLIHHHGKETPVGLIRQVSERLGSVGVTGTISFSTKGLKPDLEYKLNDLESAYSYAFGLILDESNGLLNRVGHCRHCGKYFVDFPEGKARPRILYCSDKCNSRSRSRRYRQRKQKA